MRIHILGICGTFMGSLAQLAKDQGLLVTGSDDNIYPPISDQLTASGIELKHGYCVDHLKPLPDVIIVGNVVRRGWPIIEYVLNNDLPYISGPQWLADNLLSKRWVLAVAGTHGKTSTAAMLAWILDYAGLHPGFLIGGVPKNFGISARLGQSPYFVIEADEYDTAFFDKRSKFVHYHPKTLIINNIEFDHADIFQNLEAIQTQFHHLVRTVPSQGQIICPANSPTVQTVLKRGCWTPTVLTSIVGNSVSMVSNDSDWQAVEVAPDGHRFTVQYKNHEVGCVQWSEVGYHQVHNALNAIAAACHVGVEPTRAIKALSNFSGVKRRLDILACIDDVTVYDDFAHHPTAIECVLRSLRAKVGNNARIVLAIELGSYTMRSGSHQLNTLADSLKWADNIHLLKPSDADWCNKSFIALLGSKAKLFESVETLLSSLLSNRRSGDHMVFMSNRSFGQIQNQFINAIKQMAYGLDANSKELEHKTRRQFKSLNV